MNNLGILSNIDNPGQLEKLYRENKSAFKTEFNSLYPELSDHKIAAFWHERLKYESSEINWGSAKELAVVLVAAFIGGIIAKLPLILDIDSAFFYPRNIGFIIFPILTTYFIWKTGLSAKKTAMIILATLVSLVYINLLPDKHSDTLLLSCIHLPLFLWAVLGFSYSGNNSWSYPKRLEFLRYNGDLLIMSGLILIAGGMLTGITINLFSVIDISIENFYFEYIVFFCFPAVPILGTYITQTNPQLVNKVSPVIAKIFSPIVLVTLVVYLAAILFSGKDPYQDREFLLIFNILLIGVMAIILFSVAEVHKQNANRVSSFILFALSLVTIVVNGIALSAILFRISEWGITPNRLAVLGGNILMLINLCMVAFQLFRHVSNKTEGIEVGNSIAMFLPVYCLWTIIVTFIFPFLFHFN